MVYGTSWCPTLQTSTLLKYNLKETKILPWHVSLPCIEAVIWFILLCMITYLSVFQTPIFISVPIMINLICYLTCVSWKFVRNNVYGFLNAN